MKNNRFDRNTNIRQSLAQEAARLMYEDFVDQYYDAKRLAAKRLLHNGSKHQRYRPKDLPSNGEISHELKKLAALHEGDDLLHRLFSMRLCALEVMDELENFTPRLIGSVSTGHIRRGSDIDLHVFCDELELLKAHIDVLGWPYTSAMITIQKSNQLVDYTHIYIQHRFPIELSVYPVNEIRVCGRSSTDGKKIIRLSAKRLQQLITDEHAEDWQSYLHTNDKKPGSDQVETYAF